MRCFFLRDGHVAAVEILTALSDKDAIAQARSLFSERGTKFDRFEVWDRARVVLRHPETRRLRPVSKAIPAWTRAVNRTARRDKASSSGRQPSFPESSPKRRTASDRRFLHYDEAGSL